MTMKFDTTRNFFLFVQKLLPKIVQLIFNLRSRYFLTHKGCLRLRCVYVSLKFCQGQNLKQNIIAKIKTSSFYSNVYV